MEEKMKMLIGFILGFSVAVWLDTEPIEVKADTLVIEYVKTHHCAPLPHKKPYRTNDILNYLEGISLVDVPNDDIVARLWKDVCNESKRN